MSNHISRKRFLKLAGMGATGAVLAACTPITPAPAPAAPATEAPKAGEAPQAPVATQAAAPAAGSEQASLEFVMNDSPGWADAVNAMMAKFMEKNPNVKVKFTPIEFGQLSTVLPPRFAAKEPPDLLLTDVFWPWTQQGLILDLQPEIERDNVDLKSIADTQAGVIMGDPKRYGLPFDFTGSVIGLNKTLFDKYGVPMPKADWTTADLREAAIKLTRDANDKSPTDSGFDAKNIKTYGVLLQNMYFWGALVNMFGGRMWSQDGKTCTIDSPKAMESFKYFSDLACQQHALYGPQPSATAGATDPFVSQQVAITIDGEWQLALWKDIADFDWDVVGWPKGPAEEWQYGASDSLGIAKDSKYKEQAWQFMKYWIWDKEAATITGKIMPPALNDIGLADDLMVARTGKRGPKMENLKAAYTKMRQKADGSIYYQGIRGDQWQPVLGEMLTDLLTLCQESPEQLVTQTAKQITDILQKPAA